jgi:DUF4097 and DUF4098 domain-containing protein YvlB
MLAALATACGGAEGTTVEYSENVDRIVVTSGEGQVSITGDENADRTEIETTITASGGNPEPSLDLAAGVLTIVDGCGSRDDCEVEITVTMPPSVEIQVTTNGGAIAVSDTIGAAVITTDSGAISLNGIEGDLTITTVSGSVLGARLEAATATVDADSGDVDLTFDEPVSSVEVTTGVGNATVQVAGEPYNIVTSTDSGSIDIVVDHDPNVERRIGIATGSGDIKVYRK